MLNRSLKWLLVMIAVLTIAFMLMRVDDTDRQAMIEKYGGAQALWVEDGHGGQIHYRDQGRRDAPVLLLLHGSNASLHTWEGLIDLLQNEYRLISFDQHGHGLTGPHPNGDYSAAAKIDAANRVLAAAGVEQAVWVGNSMGGWLTWRAALHQPERIPLQVLIDASGVVGRQQPDIYLGARLARSVIGKAIAPYITPRSLIAKSVEQNYAKVARITPAVVDRYWELLRFPGNRRAIRARAEASRELEYWQRIGEIKQPSLILWGQHDSVTPLSWSADFHAALPNSELHVFADAGHLPMEEIPRQVAAELHRWLAQHLPEN